MLALSDSASLLVRMSTADLFEVEATYAPGGARPPKHWHPHHDEFFEVLSGTLRVGFADEEREFSAGATIEIPRGMVHHMWNPGDEPTRVRWASTPAGRVERYFTAIDRLNRGGRTGLLGLAGVLRDYRDVMVPASPLTRAAVCLLAPLSRSTGR
jgi:quercetin dioxygenase-like cupin family protein